VDDGVIAYPASSDMVQLDSIKASLNQKAGDIHPVRIDAYAGVPASGPDHSTCSQEIEAFVQGNFIIDAGCNLQTVAARGCIDGRLQIRAYLYRRAVCHG
jgi:hypothetical protein